MQIYDIPINDNLKETTQHGSLAFPIAIYEDQLDLNLSGFVNLHWHEELQFCYVIKGCVEFHVNQKTYIISENEGIFINSNYLHMSKAVKPADSTYICYNFSPKILCSFPGSIIDSLYVQPVLDCSQLSEFTLRRDNECESGVLDQLMYIYNVFVEKQYGYQLLIVSELINIWYQLIHAKGSFMGAAKEVESMEQQRIKLALQYMHNQYMNKISLSDIASSIHISKGECCRLFKRITKSTPFDYLLLYRIKQSIILLETTNLPIGEIVTRVGFSSFSYFVERFKKTVGCVPKECRGKSGVKKHPSSKEA